MEGKINLLDLTVEEIERLVEEIGGEKYRAKQIYRWINDYADIDDMTNLSKNFRQNLRDTAYVGKLTIKHKLVSKIDGTVKYLFGLSDNNAIESVLMKYKHGFTACISSQIGCRMGCSFCASSGPGLVRNLTSGEMLGQILAIQKDEGIRIGNIVIMGIGEPFDNYENVIKFLKLVNHAEGLNIGYRHITVSTCGIVPRIIELSKENIPITLSISLHGPNDSIRSQIMPINRKYSIDKLIDACKIYTEATRRRVTFEYALIQDVNDSSKCAFELGERIKKMLCHVNLIPVNSVNGVDFRKSSREKIVAFKNILGRYGIEATVRRELGGDIEAACGQLRRSTMNI